MPTPQIVRTKQGHGTFSWADGQRYKAPMSATAEFSESYKQLLLKLRTKKKEKEAEKMKEMLDIYDMRGIVDIQLDERNAQVYFNNGNSEWELYLSNGSMLHLNSKQDAVNLGIRWVNKEVI